MSARPEAGNADSIASTSPTSSTTHSNTQSAAPKSATTPAGPALTRYDGLDVIRIIAATVVVVAHCFDLTGHTASKPGFHVGQHYMVLFGRLGVYVFFVISGFLIAASWERDPHAFAFLRRRVTRIFPALLVVVLLTVCVVGPIASSKSVGEYFTSRQTLQYGLRNSTMLLGMEHHLPGVFVNHPNGSVNGSLWTLPYELWAYVLVMALGVIGLLRRTAFVLLALGAAVWVFHYGVVLQRFQLNQSLFGITERDGLELGMLFLVGVLLARLRHRVDVRVFAVPGIVAIVSALLLNAPLLFLLGLGVATIGVGAFGGRVARGIRRFGDPSYGMYICSYPIQQALFASRVARTPVSMFLLSFPLSVAIAYASWHFVESPAIRLGRRRKRKDAARGSAGSLVLQEAAA
ncbi:MAG TPA: acyltransferase [Acidimicrobiia bacterium]